MLLTISTTHYPATDLGFLLYKHPDKFQTFEITSGKAHVFYPEATDVRCTVALLLEIDPIELVRKLRREDVPSFALKNYVNDRPYVASSFFSVAMGKVFRSALNGICTDRPDLINLELPFQVRISILHCRGGEKIIKTIIRAIGI